MKHKFIGLLSVAFLMCASTTIAVHAENETTTVENPTTVIAVETTTPVAKKTTPAYVKSITVNKTIKVNKKASIKKDIKLNKTKLKNFTLVSNKTKVATISSSGKIKAKKAGKAVITVKSKNNSALYATINVKVKNRYTKDQLRLMSSIIYSEAGDQSYAGKKAVGIVIANRVSSRSYPNTLSGVISKDFPGTLKKVIYQPGQFSPARNGSLNRSLALYDSGRLDKGSIKAAKAVLNGDKNVKLSYGTINMNSYLFFSGYVRGARLTIGGHQFK